MCRSSSVDPLGGHSQVVAYTATLRVWYRRKNRKTKRNKNKTTNTTPATGNINLLKLLGGGGEGGRGGLQCDTEQVLGVFILS